MVSNMIRISAISALCGLLVTAMTAHAASFNNNGGKSGYVPPPPPPKVIVRSPPVTNTQQLSFWGVKTNLQQTYDESQSSKARARHSH